MSVTGLALINKLNAEVVRKTEEAVAEATNSGKKLDIAYQVVLRPISAGGIWAGSPVYVRRAVWPTYVTGTLAFIMAASGILNTGFFACLVCMLVMFLWYDFYSGILHVVLDEPLNINAPVIGQPALEFQWHHFLPTDIVRKDFSDVIGDLNIVAILSVGWHFVFSTNRGSNHVAATLAGLKLFFAWYGQMSHRCAHNPKIAKMPVAQFLQKTKLMISVRDHKVHHTRPHDEDFCLIGVMNPVIDALRKVTTNRYAWLGFFLLSTIFDIAILARLCQLVV